MRGIATGGALDLEYKSVPVVLNTTALIRNTIVTVMLTCVLGEYETHPLSCVRFYIYDLNTLISNVYIQLANVQSE